MLLLSERNLNKVDRVEPTRLRPSNDFSESWFSRRAAIKIALEKEEHKKEKATYIKNRQKFAVIVVVELVKCEQRKKELEKQIAKLTAN